MRQDIIRRYLFLSKSCSFELYLDDYLYMYIILYVCMCIHGLDLDPFGNILPHWLCDSLVAFLGRREGGEREIFCSFLYYSMFHFPTSIVLILYFATLFYLIWTTFYLFYFLHFLYPNFVIIINSLAFIYFG